MLLNSLLFSIQKVLSPLSATSVVLKNIDWLIFINILLVIITSGFAPSDNIGYFALLAIIFTVVKLLTKSGERFTLTLGDKFLLIYFLLVIVSVAGSSLFLLSLKGFFKTFIYLGFYVAFIHYLKDNKNMLKYIFITIGFVLIGESLIAFKQNFLSVSEISGWQDVTRLNPEEVMTRVYGALKPYNPNLFGGYILATLPSLLTFIFIPLLNNHKKTSVVGVITFIIAIITVFLTGCRGAYLGLFVELVLFTILTYDFLKPFYKKMFSYITTMFASIGCLIILTTTSLRARILSIFAMRGDSSNSFRFNVYNSCIEMFKDNWILGIGVGNQNFREIYGLYMRTGFDALSAYNIFLEIALESGIFALIVFVGFIFENLLRAVKYIKKIKDAYSIYLSIAVISICGMLVHGVVDTVFFRPQIQFIFWIMVGTIRVITTTRGNYEIRK